MAAKANSKKAEAASVEDKDHHHLSDPDWGLVYKFAIALEKGRFNEYISTLQDTRKLFWKSLVSGVGKGLGAVIGATVVVALLATLIAAVGPYLPKPIGPALQNVGQDIQSPTK